MAAETSLDLTTTLDVISKQRALVDESLGGDGVYIRMKETLQEILDNGEMSTEDKSKIVAETLAGLSSSITQNSMNTALKWAIEEKQLFLEKEKLEYELDVIDLQADKLAHDVEASLADMQLKQAKLLREYGTPTVDIDGNVTSLNDTGLVYTQIQNTAQDTLNKVKDGTRIEATTESLQAKTHQIIADTYVNHGVFTWTTLDNNGLTGVSKASTGYTTLSDMNKYVAKEQAYGYTYNAWSNAATSSAGMIGTVIASEVDLGVNGYAPYLQQWETAITKLNGTNAGENVEKPSITI